MSEEPEVNETGEVALESPKESSPESATTSIIMPDAATPSAIVPLPIIALVPPTEEHKQGFWEIAKADWKAAITWIEKEANKL